MAKHSHSARNENIINFKTGLAFCRIDDKGRKRRIWPCMRSSGDRERIVKFTIQRQQRSASGRTIKVAGQYYRQIGITCEQPLDDQFGTIDSRLRASVIKMGVGENQRGSGLA